MKNTKNAILIVLLILGAIGIGLGLFGYFSKKTSAPVVVPPTENVPTDTPTDEIVDVSVEEPSFEEKTVFIGPHKIECVGIATQLCFQIKANPDDDWLLFYGQIERFTWEEGFIYELRVAIHQVENPPADASSLQYELIEIVNKEAHMPEVADPYIEIRSPSDGDIVNSSHPISIQGMGAGLFEGNVVVQITDMDGVVLIKQPTTQQTDEIGGEGPWSIKLVLDGIAIEEGVITAFSPSPLDGSWTASDSITIKFSASTDGELSLEGPTWQLVAFADESLKESFADLEVTMNLDPERGTAAGKSACNNYFCVGFQS